MKKNIWRFLCLYFLLACLTASAYAETDKKTVSNEKSEQTSSSEIGNLPSILSLKNNHTQSANSSQSEQETLSDEEFLNTIQRAHFNYMWEGAEPTSGLAYERIHEDGDYGYYDPSIITTGGSGFGIAGLIVAMDRGFITRKEGVERLQRIVAFLKRAERFHGIWPHWLNLSGKAVPFSKEDDGGDLVESSFLMEGLLCARQYMDADIEAEKQVIDGINELWHEMEFDWYRKDGQDVLYWHWSPNYGWKMNLPIEGYNEGMIAYILAASSPTHPCPASCYHKGWARSGKICADTTFNGYQLQLKHNGAEATGGPLFWAHYSWFGLCPIGLRDKYADYGEAIKAHVLSNYAYCVENPKGYPNYSENCWGLTAGYSVDGYAAHAPNNDLGVITTTAALSSFPYAPEQAMAAARYWYKQKNSLWGAYGFYDGYSDAAKWYPKHYLAIDQLTIAPMIENYRTGLLWRLFMSCPEIKQGLKALDITYKPSMSDTNTSAIQPLRVIRRMADIHKVDNIEPFGDCWYCGKRIIGTDLSKEPGLAYSMAIGDKNKFTNNLPAGYDPKKLLEWGKYSGLNVDILHKHGFTGKGAVIAYIDQPIGKDEPTYHEQYVSGTIHYKNNTKSKKSMHGPAVLSLLAGKDTGTAPEAEIYYYAFASWEADQLRHSECLYQIIEQNKLLPDNKKIRMVGFSDNIDESEKNADAFRAATKACEEAGVMVWFCGDYGALSFIPYSDKNSFDSLAPVKWWGNGIPDLVCVPTAGRTTAATLDRTKYIYWTQGGLSWAMPYVLGLYAIAIDINPSLTKKDLRKMIVDTAYINSEEVPVINPVGFVAAALKSVGRNEEAQTMLDEAKARTKYLYAVMNTATMTEKDLTAISNYLTNFTDATVLTVDAAKFGDARTLYATIQKDSRQRGGKVAGIQIFGNHSIVPSFKINYKVQKADGIYEGGSLLTDLFYGNFNNDSGKLNPDYSVMDHMAKNWNIDLIPQWPVARLPLNKGEFEAFLKKYKDFATDTGFERPELVNFSRSVPVGSNKTRNLTSAFLLGYMDMTFDLMDVPYRLYGVADCAETCGDFEVENMATENKKEIVEFFIDAHGQADRFDKSSFVNGEEQYSSFINIGNINTVLSENPYYLDAWSSLNGYGMENNLTTAALNGKCVGMFSATADLYTNSSKLDLTFWEDDITGKLENSNFYSFYFNYLKALNEGLTRSQAFFIAQSEYAKGLISDSRLSIREDEINQFNLYNLLAYHNFGVIEPNVVAMYLCDSEGYINKSIKEVKKLRRALQKAAGKIDKQTRKNKLTAGNIKGDAKTINYEIKNKLAENELGTIYSFNAQSLDNDYTRFTVEYSVPPKMLINIKDSNNYFCLYDLEGTPQGKGILKFDLSNDDIEDVSDITIKFYKLNGDDIFTVDFKTEQLK